MPGSTTNGYRYPLDNDPAADGAQAVRNLAQDVDDKAGVSRSGSVTVTIVADDTGSAVATFPAGHFSAVPHVLATTGNPNFYARVGATTVDDVVLHVHHRFGTVVSGDVVVDWFAHQN